MKRQTSRFPDLTVIRTVPGLMRAQVLKAKLEAEGIPVLLDYESLGRVYGITVDGLGAVRLLVPHDRAEEAEAIIEEQQPGDSAAAES